MLLDAERSLVLYCPACGTVHAHQLSLFTIKKNAPMTLPCSCGFNQGHIEQREDAYRIGIFLPSGERVQLRLRRREIRSADIIVLRHPQTRQELGFFGRPKTVNATAGSWPGMVSLDEEHYVRPEIMNRVLEILRQLAEDLQITCRCPKPAVGLDVYSDKVELTCSHCGSAVLIGAASPRDLERVEQLEQITMEPSSYTFLEQWLRPFE